MKNKNIVLTGIWGGGGGIGSTSFAFECSDDDHHSWNLERIITAGKHVDIYAPTRMKVYLII